VDGAQLRKGPAYLMSPGASLAFGDETWTVDYQEKPGNAAAAEALFQGMLAGASDEVRSAAQD